MYIYSEKLTYSVSLLGEDGVLYDLTPTLTSLQWQEEQNALAQKAVLNLGNLMVDGVWLMSIVKLGCGLFVRAECGGMVHTCFSGTVWDWGYSSGRKKEIKITAYDKMKFLQQSSDYGYFTAGQTTESLLSLICQEWGIPLYYWWSQSINHEKQVFNNTAISDMILEILEEVKDQTGVPYVCLWADDMLVVKDYGTDPDIFFIGEHATFSTKHSLSLDELVTRVKVMGNGDNEGRTPVEAVVDGDQSFGILQKIITTDSEKTLAEVTAEAEKYLEEYEKAQETVDLTCLDIPFLRKGYHVQVSAGDLVGTFRVLGVSHLATDKEMDLTLERVEA